MKVLNDSKGNVIDVLDTIEEAVLLIVEMWHEADRPDVYYVTDEENMVAATIAPVGSDKAVVVYANGQIDTYSHIHYVMKGEKYDYTSCYYNQQSYETRLNTWIK